MKTTANYGLKKPDGFDAVNIEDLNYNVDMLDLKLKEVENKNSNITVNASNVTTASGSTVEAQLADMTKLGQDNQAINKVKAIALEVDTRTTELVEQNGVLKQVLEKDGSNTIKSTTLNYDSNNNLTSVIESAGGTTVTKTLIYDTNGNLKSVTKAVSKWM